MMPYEEVVEKYGLSDQDIVELQLELLAKISPRSGRIIIVIRFSPGYTHGSHGENLEIILVVERKQHPMVISIMQRLIGIFLSHRSNGSYMHLLARNVARSKVTWKNSNFLPFLVLEFEKTIFFCYLVNCKIVRHHCFLLPLLRPRTVFS